MSTVRKTANRVRTTLAWLDAHADDLPDGRVNVDHYSSGTVVLAWFGCGYDQDAQDAVAAALTTHLGAGEEIRGDRWEGTTWPAEDDRPEIVVHGGLASRAGVSS